MTKHRQGNVSRLLPHAAFPALCLHKKGDAVEAVQMWHSPAIHLPFESLSFSFSFFSPGKAQHLEESATPHKISKPAASVSHSSAQPQWWKVTIAETSWKLWFGTDKVGSLHFWNSTVFWPKGVSTETLSGQSCLVSVRDAGTGCVSVSYNTAGRVVVLP